MVVFPGTSLSVGAAAAEGSSSSTSAAAAAAGGEWSAKEELMLLDGIDLYGFGNWRDIASLVGSRTEQQCQRHYHAVYLDPAGPMARARREAEAGAGSAGTGAGAGAGSITGGGLGIPVGNSAAAASLPAPSPGPTPTLAGGAGTPGFPQSHIPRVEVAGFMPLRGDFDIEHDNEAEALLADLDFVEGEHASESELKLRLLEVYCAKLSERERRKAFVLERGLLDFKRILATERRRPREERELYDALRPFARFMSAAEHEDLARGLILENRLRKRIAALAEYRRLGLTSLAEAAEYESAKKRNALPAFFRGRAAAAAASATAAAHMSSSSAGAGAGAGYGMGMGMGVDGEGETVSGTRSSAAAAALAAAASAAGQAGVAAEGVALSALPHVFHPLYAPPTASGRPAGVSMADVTGVPRQASSSSTGATSSSAAGAGAGAGAALAGGVAGDSSVTGKKRGRPAVGAGAGSAADGASASTGASAAATPAPSPATTAAVPFSLAGIPGADRLTRAEAALCEHLAMLPYQFLQVKGTLLALAAQRGLVKPEDAGQALLHVGESSRAAYDERRFPAPSRPHRSALVPHPRALDSLPFARPPLLCSPPVLPPSAPSSSSADVVKVRGVYSFCVKAGLIHAVDISIPPAASAPAAGLA